jgi:hypothetical protein
VQPPEECFLAKFSYFIITYFDVIFTKRSWNFKLTEDREEFFLAVQ